MNPSNTPLFPLKFAPIYKEKVWGGRSLARFGRLLPGDDQTMIGESWELADLDQTSSSGGGGGSERSVISNGSLAQMTLHEAMDHFGERLLGHLQLTETGNFPLLIKFLDAKQNLSVQVHPSDEYTRVHPETHLKNEAWYVIDADPGAVIYKGIQEDVTPQQLRQAIENDNLEPLLIRVPVKTGDCHYLPSGTCHALGAGVLVAEIQNPSDTTFRIYDWGRTNRKLHVDQALECITFGSANIHHHEKRSHIAGMFTTVSRLVMCEHFCIEKVRMVESYEQEIPYDQPVVWMVLEGEGVITPGNDTKPVHFQRGETLLIPAHMDDAKVALQTDAIWLEVTFPQMQPRGII